ncbi:CMGC/MAPK/P38 protein kinase [Penicillium soppii]|uniref:CMGC/MAPK/P38 protein kinase n=1 Tax=Penicillium soppii TaxID=69789 RepID=UPI002547D48A|nr:CMGC/MAPK/P38 protein kinase [Penicillium soppii]KAJ5856457.1 CMGC/MAPK/P38 protein kinase [Penicillium soppii]
MSDNDTDTIKHNIGGCTFDIPSRYSNIKLKGFGAYGVVCSLKDNLTSEIVAIKKIPGPFRTEEAAKRTFREVKLLNHLRHDNVITLRDIFVSSRDEIYLVTDLMSTDLAHIIGAKPIEDEFIKYIFYQIMRGLKYIHSAGVVHRDLKPSNVLVDENCDVKLCDFGLARTVDVTMTGYVSMRHYRAPETMLTWQKYTVQVDIWSAGCILAEMIAGKPLFPGQSHADQFSVIADLLGSVPRKVLETISSQTTSKYIEGLPARTKQPMASRIKNASPYAIDLLEKLLVWDPEERLSAGAALAHPYLELYHDSTDEPVAEEKFDWSSVAVDHTVDTWKMLTFVVS